jgi:hypothetical protein
MSCFHMPSALSLESECGQPALPTLIHYTLHCTFCSSLPPILLVQAGTAAECPRRAGPSQSSAGSQRDGRSDRGVVPLQCHTRHPKKGVGLNLPAAAHAAARAAGGLSLACSRCRTGRAAWIASWDSSCGSQGGSSSRQGRNRGRAGSLAACRSAAGSTTGGSTAAAAAGCRGHGCRRGEAWTPAA